MPTNQQKPQTQGSQQTSKPATTPSNQQRDQRPAQGSRDDVNRDRNYGSQN